MIFAVLASGPSMRQEVADAVKGRCGVVAVSDTYKLAPWADALVSTDFCWWRHHAEAASFAGKKFSGMVDYQQVEGVERLPGESSTNSGLLGVKVAVLMGASKVLLCGFDLHSPGGHFFGGHPEGLRSTSPMRMEQFRKQFAAYNPKGVEIFNCTPGSALECYPKRDLDACMAEFAPR